MLVSKAEFSRLRGVSKVAVTHWEKKGWLVLVGGKVDVGASDALLEKYRDSKDGRAVKPAPRTAPKKPADTTPSPPDEATLRAAMGLLKDETFGLDTEEAKRLKVNIEAELLRIEHQREQGSVVELAVAEGVIFEAGRAARNAWLHWPARVAAIMAADLNGARDRMTEVLTAHVHSHITELGAPEADFQQQTHGGRSRA